MSTSRDMYFLELFKAFLHAHVRGRPVDCTQAWPYVAITQLDAGARLVDRMPVGVSVEVACGCSCTRVIQRERERCGQGSPLWRGLHPPRQRTPRSSPFPKHDGDLHLLGDDTVAHRGTPWHTVAHRGTVLMCASIKNRWPLVQASATLLPPWFEPGAVPWPS